MASTGMHSIRCRGRNTTRFGHGLHVASTTSDTRSVSPSEAQIAGLRINLLGPVALSGAGRELALSQFAQRVILAELALSANKVISVPALIDAVWPADDEEKRIRNLHFHICRLRAVLREVDPGRDGSRLVTAQRGYRLVVAPGECDLGTFRQQVSQARAAASAGRPADARRLYRRGRDL